MFIKKISTKKTSEPKKSTPSISKKGPVSKRRKRQCSSSSDEDDTEIVLESDGISETYSEFEEKLEECREESNTQNSPNKQVNPKDYAVDNFVIVKYNGVRYPGKILSLSDNGSTVELSLIHI